MSFLDQWKSAKDKFETTTKEKKPSDKFMLVFRKGTDIETSLKSLSSAKTRKDVIKAVASFDKAATEYCDKLSKEATNPSSVPKGDKTVYVAAIEKLKKSLEKIKTEAEHMADSLEVTADKTKVDSKAMQAAEQHMAKQRKAIEKVNSALQELAKCEKEMKEIKGNAAKALKDAIDPKKAGMAADVAGQTVIKFYQQLTDLRLKTAKPVYDGAKKTLSDLVKKDATTIDEVKSSREPLPDRVGKEAKKMLVELAKVEKDLTLATKRLFALDTETLEYTKEIIPLDRDALQDDTAHVELREKLIDATAQWAKDAKKELTDVERLLVAMKKLHVNAQKAHQQNNKPEIAKQEVDAQKVLVVANRIAKKVNDEEAKRTGTGSPLMKGREDGGVGDKLPPRVGGPLRKRGNLAFDKFDANQRVWLAAVGKINSTVTNIGAYVEQIEAFNGKVPSPQEYLKRFEPLIKQMTGNKVTLTTRVDKMTSAMSRAPEIAQEMLTGQIEKDKALKTLKGLKQLAQQMVGNTESTKSYAEDALFRATNLSTTAPAVVKIAGETKTLAEVIIDLCNQFEKLYPQAEKAYDKAISDVENSE